MASFTGKQIENTYQSILNIGSVANPNGTLSAVLSTITDGAGNDSSLTIGAANAGIRVTGPSILLNNTTVLGTLSSSGRITAAGNAYPITLGSNNQVLTTNGSGVLSFGYVTSSNIDPALTGASTTYTGSVTGVTVDGLGRVTGVATAAPVANQLIASANYSVTGGTVTAIGNQFNVSSIVKVLQATGHFQFNFATPAANANYRVQISSGWGFWCNIYHDGYGTRYAPSTSSFVFSFGDQNSWLDPHDMHIMVWASP